ncbi:MAG: dihydrolipoamide acetyltransferase family protein [Burkholderiales bacterium]|nr:dihydrolipoamide acetyltransferase family protein [Burkholderiales bacterium]
MIEFTMPSLGADMTEGKLIEWKVKPGDTVRRGQVVAVIETPKAAVEVETWHDGTVYELVAQPGETLPVGAVLARWLAPGEAPPAAARTPRAKVSPAARRRAAELGVNADTLVGSGPDGAVTVADVENAAAARAPAPASAEAAAKAPESRAADMRRAIAAAMSRAKREIPHYYLAETVPLARALAWLEAENARRPLAERLLVAALFIKATALACREVPEMNGHCVDGEFRPASSVHVGVAISLRQGGLVAPAIHDVQEKPLAEVMRALRDLVGRARAGTLRASEMTDATITVTSLGEGGVETVFGVIYPPQVALVGFGSVKEGRVVATLSADHRVSDGHRGALFLGAIARLLQTPEAL